MATCASVVNAAATFAQPFQNCSDFNLNLAVIAASAYNMATGGGVTPRATTSTSTLITSNSNVAAADLTRTAFYIQNLQTTALYYYLGTGCSLTTFSGILVPCQSVNDGYGGSIRISAADYNGPISLFAASGSPRAIVSSTNIA